MYPASQDEKKTWAVRFMLWLRSTLTYVLPSILPNTPTERWWDPPFVAMVIFWRKMLLPCVCMCASAEEEGSMWPGNTWVHCYEFMRIMGCLHRRRRRWERHIQTEQPPRTDTPACNSCWGALTFWSMNIGATQLHGSKKAHRPDTKQTWMYRALPSSLKVGSWVWSITCYSQEEGNELTLNWMWSGPWVPDNTTHCPASTVEPHHQHNAL